MTTTPTAAVEMFDVADGQASVHAPVYVVRFGKVKPGELKGRSRIWKSDLELKSGSTADPRYVYINKTQAIAAAMTFQFDTIRRAQREIASALNGIEKLRTMEVMS